MQHVNIQHGNKTKTELIDIFNFQLSKMYNFKNTLLNYYKLIQFTSRPLFILKLKFIAVN